MRVLIIEDDPDMLGFLGEHLPEHGFVVDMAETGTAGLRLAQTNSYDLVILDLNLPDMQGEDVVTELHGRESIPPILLLTVTSDAESKVRLLSAGADDYLAKPFSFNELVARMRALLRRSRDLTPDLISTGDVTLDLKKKVVTRKGKNIALTLKEFTLFTYLMRHRGVLVPKGTLIEHAWNESADPFSNSVETHMTNLRRKLGKPDPIHTVHGRGYTID